MTIDKHWREADAMDPIQSTYLDLGLDNILWEVADDDLAAFGRLGGLGGGDGNCFGLSILVDSSHGSGGGSGFGTRSGTAGDALLDWAAAAPSSRLVVLHDLVQRLIQLSRHVELRLVSPRESQGKCSEVGA
jgi:hypothetical protein